MTAENTVFGEENIGRVESVSGDVCAVVGLEGVALNNLVEFSSLQKGIVLGFSGERTQVIIVGSSHYVKKGDLVRIVDEVMNIGFSPDYVGRIINPLGEPLDGRGAVKSSEKLNLESKAVGVNQRANVSKPLSTGFLVIDSQIPIGRGQRELLIGDKKIGKSDVGIAAIGNQIKVNSGVIGIYVTIDAQTLAAKRRISQLKSYGALDKSIVIIGRSSDPAALNYLAPMTAVTIAEGLARKGKDALVVFDNLTRHAKVYRQISLLLKRASGREAYPGDVFYLHSRLLERCGAFSDEIGGGTITALPIVETQGEEITDYITTNLMSITDGHILFRLSLANKGIRPAVDCGFSVSRIGGRAQSKLIGELSDLIKSMIIRYSEVEKFSLFGAELHESTREVIELGQRITAVFNQRSNELFSLKQQVLLLYLIASKQILKWETTYAAVVRSQLMSFVDEKGEARALAEKLDEGRSIEEQKATLDKILELFASDPKTAKQIEKREASQAEKETIIDILRDSSPDSGADIAKAKKSREKNANT